MLGLVHSKRPGGDVLGHGGASEFDVGAHGPEIEVKTGEQDELELGELSFRTPTVSASSSAGPSSCHTYIVDVEQGLSVKDVVVDSADMFDYERLRTRESPCSEDRPP